MKPVVGELMFCTGRYCKIIFICNIFFGALTVFLNAFILIALKKIANRNKWTASNVILFPMVLTDLLTGLICQPLHAYFIYREENVYNEEELSLAEAWLFFALNYTSYSLCCASLLLSAVMALERLFAIAYTMKHRASSSIRRSAIAVSIACLISLIIPIFRFVSKHTKVVFMALLVIVVLVALSTVVIAYTVLFRSFKKQRVKSLRLSTSDKAVRRGLLQEKSLAKSFAIISTVLLLMYLPQMLLKPISIATDIQASAGASQLFVILEDSFNTLLYCNSAVNPFIYFVRQADVRREIKSFKCCCEADAKDKAPGQSDVYSISLNTAKSSISPCI
eukprot:Seg1260.10 transcript_id=Seg1260.10/GoldUCD/mRNA.D3Y31 product="hypothetical protein" protein_id=Seg1260.10/GoldUCD/D3Y31